MSTAEEIEDMKARIAASLDKLEELQKQLDQEQEREHERYLGEQGEARIEAELHSAKASLRSLRSALPRLADLAEQFPAHPKFNAFSTHLDTLVGAIQQLSKKLSTAQPGLTER
jgi:chromosome segregation ATPase